MKHKTKTIIVVSLLFATQQCGFKNKKLFFYKKFFGYKINLRNFFILKHQL